MYYFYFNVSRFAYLYFQSNLNAVNQVVPVHSPIRSLGVEILNVSLSTTAARHQSVSAG